MARRGQAPREWDDEVREAIRRVRRRQSRRNALKTLIGVGFLSGALLIAFLLLPDSVISGLRKTWDGLIATATAPSTTTSRVLPPTVPAILGSQVESSRTEAAPEVAAVSLLPTAVRASTFNPSVPETEVSSILPFATPNGPTTVSPTPNMLPLQIPTSSPPTLEVSSTVVNSGEQITVIYSGTPGGSTDWIAILSVDAPNEDYHEWYYLSNTDGALTFSAPSLPGTYEFRLLPATQHPHQLHLTRCPFPALTALTPPASLSIGCRYAIILLSY